MRRITYGSETFVVDDRVGDDLMERARTVAATRDPEVVEIPVIHPDGSIRLAAMLIGPSTPVLSVDAPDLDAVARRRPVAALGRVSPINPAVVYDDSHTYFDLGFDS